MASRLLQRAVVGLVAGVLVGCSSPQTASDGSTTSMPSIVAPTASAASSSPNLEITPAPTAPTPSSTTVVQRFEVPGGPLGLDVADGHAWVVATDAGQLIDVDLATGATVQMDIGSSPNWIKVLDDGRLVVSRYASADGRATLEIIDPASGHVTPAAEDPIEGLDVDGRTIWAFAKSGTILAADPDGKVLGQTTVEVTENEHMDVVGTGDAAFASSDSTAVRRVRGTPLQVDATIETGGGVPFVEDGGLVWGARADEVWAIDPAAGAVTRRYPLMNVSEILDLDVEGDDAWIAVRHPGRVGAVIRLDLTTGDEVADNPADLPAAVVIAGGSAWVTDYSSGALLGFER